MIKPAATSTRDWTPEQLRGIQTVGKNLLVSAAAGSGKTAVLAERCAYLVCDAKAPCDVDQLLVVTFTEAAAAEMKARIAKALRDRLAANEEDPRLLEQLALVERAQVSTLHGFCARLLRQNFHLLGLDPAFTMLDGDEATLLRLDVAREVIAQRFENDPTGDFARLVRVYAGGDEESLIPHILRAHAMLESIVDPGRWMQDTLDRIAQAATGNFAASELGKELIELLAAEIDFLISQSSQAVELLKTFPHASEYVKYAQNLQATLGEWRSELEAKGLTALSALVSAYKPGRIPSLKADTPDKELIQGTVKSIKEEMAEGRLAQLARFTTADWQTSLAVTLQLVTVLLNVVTDFSNAYRTAKDRSDRLDFADLERFALKVLRDPADPDAIRPSPVARTCHAQYQHVLVDEYQDINQVQDAIISLVSRECVSDSPHRSTALPNLFTVGDVKQSIYRFRLADPQRFLERQRRLGAASVSEIAPSLFNTQAESSSRGELIDLQHNFRSRGPLLEVINQIFSRLMTQSAAEIEYDESHHLRPKATYPIPSSSGFTGAPVELHLLPEKIEAGESDEPLDRAEREAAFVARRIAQLMGQADTPQATVADKLDGALVNRPIRYGDIVILLRSMKVKADQYADALRAANIPVHREGGQGFFSSTEIRDMRALLTILDNPRQDIPLAAVLRSPILQLNCGMNGSPEFSPEDLLARIRLAYPQAPFHDAAFQYADEHSTPAARALKFFFGLLDSWRHLARFRPLAELIWHIYTQTGYLAFVEGLIAGPQRVANLLELHRRAAQFGDFARQGLYRFLKFLQSLEEEADIGQPSIVSPSQDVVRIMSIHHSKGLEFPVVFVPELGKKFNLQDTHGAVLLDKRLGLALHAFDESLQIRYPSLSSVLVSQALKRHSLAEELRILYVAFTRAKEHLILSATVADNARDRWHMNWSDHAGPMPTADFLKATTPIQWIGPVSAMAAGAFDVTAYSSQEIAEWTAPEHRRPRLTPFQESLARLTPLSPPPAADDSAHALIRQLTTPYEYAALAQIEAARSVTQMTKQGQQVAVGYATRQEKHLPFDRTLVTPRLEKKQSQLTAAEIGAATHTVLQHFDFASPQIEPQIQKLVDSRLLTAAQALSVNRPAIEWFLQTELGRLLQAQSHHLRRELDFYLAVDPVLPTPASVAIDAEDQVMVRGRIDALVLDPAGLTLIDYKTDRVTPELLPRRVESYREQVSIYRRAVEKIARLPVSHVCLVFLDPRQIIEM